MKMQGNPLYGNIVSYLTRSLLMNLTLYYISVHRIQMISQNTNCLAKAYVHFNT